MSSNFIFSVRQKKQLCRLLLAAHFVSQLKNMRPTDRLNEQNECKPYVQKKKMQTLGTALIQTVQVILRTHILNLLLFCFFLVLFYFGPEIYIFLALIQTHSISVWKSLILTLNDNREKQKINKINTFCTAQSFQFTISGEWNTIDTIKIDK